MHLTAVQELTALCSTEHNASGSCRPASEEADADGGSGWCSGTASRLDSSLDPVGSLASSSGTAGRTGWSWAALCCSAPLLGTVDSGLGTRPDSASSEGVRLAEMECALYHVRSHRLCPSGSCTRQLPDISLLIVGIHTCRLFTSHAEKLINVTHHCIKTDLC